MCKVTFDTSSNSLNYEYTFMHFQAVIVAYKGYNCIERYTSYSSTSEAQHLPLVYSLHRQLRVSARGAVPAEELCLGEVETEEA